MPLIKQEKHRRNLVFDLVSILIIISKPSCAISSIIKNVCTVTKICITGLDIMAHTNNKPGISISLRCIGQFPIDCRPQQQELVAMDQVVVNEKFENSGIIIDSIADKRKKQNLNKRLLYTWRECFAKMLRDVKPTDLIKHSIDLKPNVCPLYSKILYYIEKKRQFCNCIFLEIEKAGIII